MSESPRGWCPGVFAPMPAADGLLVRVKPRAARLSAMAARDVAEAVARYGNGRIELTSRANLQVRGLTEADAPAFAAAMVACGAADADPQVERRRNIVVSPLAGDDPTLCGDPDRVATRLAHELARSGLALPDKFGFSVDGGGVLPLGDVAADVALHARGDVWQVQIAGAAQAVLCAQAEAARVAVTLARGFLALGGTRRMRDTVRALGEEAVYATLGARPMGAAAAAQRGGHPDAVTPYPGASRCAIALVPISGDLDPATLIRAADCAERFGDGMVRVSPWRALLIGGVAREHVRALAA